MNTDQKPCIPPPGWLGGFADSRAEFAYPNPDLSHLPLLDNMDNIDLIDRQQGVEWPEFSWETDKDNPTDTMRCFQMFAPYISRVGYDNYGRIYSIICPQQGTFIHKIGCINVEVTVTGQRGWVNEPARTYAADMSVVGKIWFSPSAHQNFFVKMMWDLFAKCDLPFPSHKSKAIRVNTHLPGHPDQPYFPVRTGTSDLFKSPDFAIPEGYYGVADINVQIGDVQSTGSAIVDEFNSLVMDLFNLGSGNLLQPGNILSWNVYMACPTLVDREEWRTHAERWRKSIDEGHGSPYGPGTPARLFNGDLFNPVEAAIEEKIEEIFKWVMKHMWHMPQ